MKNRTMNTPIVAQTAAAVHTDTPDTPATWDRPTMTAAMWDYVTAYLTAAPARWYHRTVTAATWDYIDTYTNTARTWDYLTPAQIDARMARYAAARVPAQTTKTTPASGPRKGDRVPVKPAPRYDRPGVTLPRDRNTPRQTDHDTDFPALLRSVETAPTGDNLTTWGAAVAHSVLKKVADPRRTAAADSDRNTPSNSGQNPAILSIKRDLSHDMALLENLPAAVDMSTTWKYNDDGEVVTENVDKNAAVAVAAIIGDTLGDGIDLAHDAIVETLSQWGRGAWDYIDAYLTGTDTPAAADVTAPAWMEQEYTARRLSRRVYVKLSDSAAYRDDVTTPVQEVYRAVRRSVDTSRAVQTDPRNGYTYVDMLTTDGADTLFYRSHKYADIGGAVTSGHCGTPGTDPAPGTLYTAGDYPIRDRETLLSCLDLTARQAQILRLREQGHGYKAIATYLGVTDKAVKKTVRQIQKKAAAAWGYTAPENRPDTLPTIGETRRPAHGVYTDENGAYTDMYLFPAAVAYAHTHKWNPLTDGYTTLFRKW